MQVNGRKQRQGDIIWKLLTLLKDGTPGNSHASNQQGIADDKGILRYGADGAEEFKKFYEYLGAPIRTKQSYFSSTFKALT